VKGGVWFSLIDKVWNPRNLAASWAKVKANDGAAGVDHQTVAMMERDLEAQLHRLGEQLRQGSYRPQAVRRVYIPKPGSSQKRPLGIPTVRDRVVQGALRHVLEPILERQFAEHSYGFRPGRSAKDALRRVDGLLKAGYRYVVDADLQGYFDSIPHQCLLERVREQVADGRVLELIGMYLKQGVLDGMAQWTPTAGSPQGAVLSPLLANLYLNPLDHQMARQGYAMVRYADDFVILCRTPQEAQAALEEVQRWVTDNGLVLHPTKTRIADAEAEGFDFLGYHFERGRKWPRDKSLGKVKDAIRRQTRRSDGRSLACILVNLNRVLRGWFHYFQHSRRSTFVTLDGWVRMRLRSLLRRRQGRRGRGRGTDHQRWPNAFFDRQGLWSLAQAHAALCQSLRG
jgi:RNA-directed DNA polymerase